MSAPLSWWFPRAMRSSKGARQLPTRRFPCKPKLEALEDRDLLSIWSSVTPMPTARTYLAGARTFDLGVYAIGGEDRNGNFVNTVEAYFPFTNTWSTLPGMPTGRDGLAAATSLDGRIFAYGGYDGANFLNTVEVYSPFTRTWTTASPMTTARSGLAGAAGFQSIYAFGGYDGSNYLKTAEVYNVFTNTWSPIANMSIARYGAAAAPGFDGRIYVFGGLGFDPDSGFFGPLNTVEVYSPRTNTWIMAPPMANAREFPGAATSFDGRILVLGGQDGQDNPLSSVEVFNPFSNSWSTTESMPTARFGLAAVPGFDGHIYAMGGTGVDPTSGVLTPLDTVEAILFFPGFGGAASRAQSADDLAAGKSLSTPVAIPLTVIPLLEKMDSRMVPDSHESSAVLRNQADRVFAAGADTLSDGLANRLFASRII